MELEIYQVDAFADKIFKGNPAAVVPLREWLPDETLLNITKENNLSETAFFVRNPIGYDLRWFTSVGEIDLCGHATLASAFVLIFYLYHAGTTIRFFTRQAGELQVRWDGDYFIMDLPARPPIPEPHAPAALVASLNGIRPKEILISRDYLVVYDDEKTVRKIKPDWEILEKQVKHRVCITAPGRKADFVSRFFCAGEAMAEDPVTGSSHCTLVPYWAPRLNKREMLAEQLSERGGFIKCRMEKDRVYLSGRCAIYLIGKIYLGDA